MSEKLKEAISAAMDGEADEFELRRVVDEAVKQPDLRETWHRYHLVSAVLRGERPDAGMDLRHKVWAALDYTEQAGAPSQVQDIDDGLVDGAGVAAASAAGVSPWVGRITGFAVAASVAMAVLIASGVFQTETPQPVGPSVAQVVSDASRAQPIIAATQDAAQRANAYRVHHAQQMAMSRNGALSFVKLVTYKDAPAVNMSDDGVQTVRRSDVQGGTDAQ